MAENTSTKLDHDSPSSASVPAEHAAAAAAPAAQVPPVLLPAPETAVQLLWYCDTCTRLILPPGEAGVVLANGDRFCTACAPFETEAARPTVAIDGKPARDSSSKVIRAFSSSSSKRFRGLDESDRSDAPAGKQHSAAWIVGGLAIMAVTLGGIWFLVFNHSAPGKIPARSDVAQLKPPEQHSPAAHPNAAHPLPPTLNSPPVFNATVNGSATAIEGTAPGTVPVPEAPTAIPVPVPVEAAPALAGERAPDDAAKAFRFLRMDDFEASLDTLQPLLEGEKFSDAGRLLDSLERRFQGAPWWEVKKPSVEQARETLRHRVETYAQAASEALAQAQMADSVAKLEAVEKIWKPKLQLGDVSAKYASRVLDTAEASRKRLSGFDDKHAAAFVLSLDALDRRVHGKSPPKDLEDLGRSVLALRSVLLVDGAAADKFGDRWAGLNFDVRALRNPERALYRLDLPATENMELVYDFNTDEQLAAWRLDSAEGAALEYETSAKSALLKVDGEHAFDAKAGKRAPGAVLPFCFKAENWSFEADVSLAKGVAHEDKSKAPAFGLYVSDGASNTIRLSLREGAKGQVNASGRGGANDKEIPFTFAGKIDEHTKVRIHSVNGMASFSVGPKSEKFGRVRLNFEPRLAGLFLETHDPQESAAVSFDNVKLSGTLDRQKLKSAMDARRLIEIKNFQAELSKLRKPDAK